MEISELNRILRNKAIRYGLCEQWQNEIWNKNLSIPELLAIYIKGFDFSVKNDWLDYDFIKEVFPVEELHKAGIYIDEEVDVTADMSGYYVFLGKCTGRLTATGFVSLRVYVRHNSNINLMALDGARMIATFYENSSANGISDEYSKCLINKGK